MCFTLKFSLMLLKVILTTLLSIFTFWSMDIIGDVEGLKSPDLTALVVIPQANTDQLPPGAFLQQADRLFFIENKGQWHSDVLYLCRMGNLDVWITKYGVNYNFYKIDKEYGDMADSHGKDPEDKLGHESPEKNTLLYGHRVLMELDGYNPFSATEGRQKQEGYYNYFVGTVSGRHVRKAELYKEVLVKNVYEGIDIRYYFDSGFLRYDFIVHPGANPKQIKFKLKGQIKEYLKEGILCYTTRFGEVQMTDLRCYQEGKEVPSSFRQEDKKWSIELGAYNKNKTLVIDPLVYSTYIGGDGGDVGRDIAIDANGNVYITGDTFASDYDITSGAYQTTREGATDAFVTKLNATGTALVYSTYIGGNDAENGEGIVVDADGNAYITGKTFSTDFDVTSGAFQTNKAGDWDVFVTKLNATGTALVYSTYIGGFGNDTSFDIAVDAGGNAYVTGYTLSTDYDVTSGVIQASNAGGSDVFVTKLNTMGTALVYSTYIGGSDTDRGYSIATDADGNAYVTGFSRSSDYNLTSGGYQMSLAGEADVFVTKLNTTGTALVYSTFIGGVGVDLGNSITIDVDGNAYTTGYTQSADYDVTSGVIQTSNAGASDIFVTKLNAAGTALLYSTYIGGSSEDRANSIAVDAGGNAYITGYTSSTDYDVTSGAFQANNEGDNDVFLTKLNASGTILLYSTYIGGSENDQGFAIAVDATSNAYVTGFTFSTDYDVTSGAFQTSKESGVDAFVTKLNLCVDNAIDVSVTTNGAVLTANAMAATYQWVSCPSFTVIEGATEQSFTATAIGSYAVIVTQNGCTDTSACYQVVTVGVDDLTSEELFLLYPNPSDSEVLIRSTKKIKEVVVYDQAGRVLYRKEKTFGTAKQIKINISSYPAGVYIVECLIEGNKIYRKIMKE